MAQTNQLFLRWSGVFALALCLLPTVPLAARLEHRSKAAITGAGGAGSQGSLACDQESAQQFVESYFNLRKDTSPMAAEKLGDLLTDDATYSIPIRGTYTGKSKIIEYVKENPASPDSVKNEALVGVTVDSTTAVAKATFDFKYPRIINWRGRFTPMMSLITMQCTGGSWLIAKVVLKDA